MKLWWKIDWAHPFCAFSLFLLDFSWSILNFLDFSLIFAFSSWSIRLSLEFSSIIFDCLHCFLIFSHYNRVSVDSRCVLDPFRPQQPLKLDDFVSIIKKSSHNLNRIPKLCAYSHLFWVRFDKILTVSTFLCLVAVTRSEPPRESTENRL